MTTVDTKSARYPPSARPAAAPGEADRSRFRDAMARFASGVTIVTTLGEDGAPYGFTASSFCSVSLDPPMVLVCLARSANSYPVFAVSPRFAVSVLGAEHTEVAQRFASKRPDKFAPGGFVPTAAGPPVLADALATVECEVAGRHDAGDHVILLGAVRLVGVAERQGAPAVHFERAFRHLS